MENAWFIFLKRERERLDVDFFSMFSLTLHMISPSCSVPPEPKQQALMLLFPHLCSHLVRLLEAVVDPEKAQGPARGLVTLAAHGSSFFPLVVFDGG